MKVLVKKWGNSATVRIPASVMAAANIVLEQSVEMRVEQGRIVIEAARRKTYNLNEMLSSITAKNQHKPFDTGETVSKEVW